MAHLEDRLGLYRFSRRESHERYRRFFEMQRGGILPYYPLRPSARLQSGVCADHGLCVAGGVVSLPTPWSSTFCLPQITNYELTNCVGQRRRHARLHVRTLQCWYLRGLPAIPCILHLQPAQFAWYVLDRQRHLPWRNPGL